MESLPEYCELTEGIVYFRPPQSPGLSDLVHRVTQAIVWARDHKIPQLVVNVVNVEGMTSPNLADRYFYMREFAAAARGEVRLAAVMPKEFIDPQKFGVMVGRNAGLKNDVFTTETEAVAWLKSSQ